MSNAYRCNRCGEYHDTPVGMILENRGAALRRHLDFETSTLHFCESCRGAFGEFMDADADDPELEADDHDAEEQELLDALPECETCGEPVKSIENGASKLQPGDCISIVTVPYAADPARREPDLQVIRHATDAEDALESQWIETEDRDRNEI
ncbi:MAG: hypothetical protein ACNA7R_15530 [Natronococcus sp.]